MSQTIVFNLFYIMILAPFILRYIIFFTEREQQKQLRIIPKLKRQIMTIDYLALLNNHVPNYARLYTLSSVVRVVILGLFCLTLGAGSVYQFSYPPEANIYAIVCLLAIVLYTALNYFLLTKNTAVAKTEQFVDFMKQHPDYPVVSTKQYKIRIWISYISWILSMLNLVVFIYISFL